MSVGQRFKRIIDTSEITVQDFAKSISQSSQSIYNYIGGKTTPKVDIAEAVLKQYPNLNAHWLLTGEGNMWKEGTGDHIHQSNVGVRNRNEVNKGMNGDLGSCLEKVKLLEKMVKDKEELIELLKKKG